MEITTLIDNVVYGNNLSGEHGFSLFIRAGDRCIVFDTGQSGQFIKNAMTLGVDIKSVNVVIISHGHYDHTGGLHHFCQENKTAKIYIQPQARGMKYKNKSRHIGIPFQSHLFENRFTEINVPVALSENIHIIPTIDIHYLEDTHFKGMYVKSGDNWEDDDFQDEQILVIIHNQSLVLISGCSHRGITNIIETAMRHFKLPVYAVFGGFHLKDETPETVSFIIEKLGSYKIPLIGVSHCTGMEAYARIRNELPHSRVFYNYTGLKTILE